MLKEARLEDLLNQLTEAVVGQKNVVVTTRIDGEVHLPARVRVAFYRVAQEAMNNVVKHGNASAIQVRLLRLQADGLLGPKSVQLIIEDDGVGFDPASVPADRMGLEIMRERVNAIGGILEINSLPGSGTVISVTWMGEFR